MKIRHVNSYFIQRNQGKEKAKKILTMKNNLKNSNERKKKPPFLLDSATAQQGQSISS